MTTTESIRTGTIIAAIVGTTLTGVAAYAVYFDYKRRNDVEFRKSLKRESKKQAKAAKVEAERSEKTEKHELRQMVDEAVEEGWPQGAEEKESYFMEEVGMGEKLCQQRMIHLAPKLWLKVAYADIHFAAGMTKEAALCFFKALRVYPQPKELMTIYDKTVPKVSTTWHE